jgi:RNA polymerase sigma factor (sigma-70 family)
MPHLRQKPGLLARFRAGERDALGEVYDAYVETVGNLVRHGFQLQKAESGSGRVTVSPQDYLDVVHEIFAKAFSATARQGYDGLRDYAPYLAMITRNAMIDWLRRRGVVAQNPELLDQLPAPPREEAAPWEDPATLAVVERYLAGLPEELKRLHQLRYRDGLSQDAAADALGVSRQNLRTLEARLRRGLAEALDQSSKADSQPTETTRSA